MSNGYIFYNTSVVTHRDNTSLPGIAAFKKFFSIYPQSSVFIDRTHTVKTPVKAHSLFPVPALVPFKKTYAEVCDERALQLLKRSTWLDAPIYVTWSGGIDSTTVLVALLKNASEAERARLVVLLTEESISEYPDFYRTHIRGKLTCDSMSLFPYLLGSDVMIVGGEGNDQVFGSDISARLISKKGPGIIHEPYNRQVVLDYFGAIINDPGVTELCVQLLERVCSKAPVVLTTHFDYLWWLSFAVKWQFVHTRMLAYTARRHVGGITGTYLGTKFDQFFNTDDFQLWSMSNMDKKIKDTWNTYKWPAKDYIYDFTNDDDYRKNKQKRGSLAIALQQQHSYNFIDSNFHCYETLDSSKWYEPDNDFV